MGEEWRRLGGMRLKGKELFLFLRSVTGLVAGLGMAIQAGEVELVLG